jgi:large subunit ribosomal protein L5
MTLNIKKNYNNIIRPDLILKKKYKNIMEIPKIKKIVLNITINSKNKIIEPLMILELITGQKAIILKAKKSISSFGIRKNQYIACKTTLNKENMYNFLNKLIHIVLPRIRDLKALPVSSMDGKGNYTLPISNIIVFPEIEYQLNILNKIYGMDITIVTTAKTNFEAELLLSNLQLPLK